MKSNVEHMNRLVSSSGASPRPCVCSIGEWLKSERATIPCQQRWLKKTMRKIDNEQRKQTKEKK